MTREAAAEEGVRLRGRAIAGVLQPKEAATAGAVAEPTAEADRLLRSARVVMATWAAAVAAVVVVPVPTAGATAAYWDLLLM